MKKIALTIAIILGLATTTFADPNGGGLFKKGGSEPEQTRGGGLVLPGQHGLSTDEDGELPLGSGIVLLTTLGAAYLIGKKRKED